MPPAPLRYASLPALRSSGRESASGEGMMKASLTSILQRLKHDSRTVITHHAWLTQKLSLLQRPHQDATVFQQLFTQANATQMTC